MDEITHSSEYKEFIQALFILREKLNDSIVLSREAEYRLKEVMTGPGRLVLSLIRDDVALRELIAKAR